MMTLAQYDRLERMARLLCEALERDVRKGRQQTKKLKRWVAAGKECEAAEEAMQESPDDSEKKETLLRARQLLEQARSDLKHSIKPRQDLKR
jgi:hypothetical protein